MEIHPLTVQEMAESGATHRAVITYADLVALGGATNTATIPIATVAAKEGAMVVRQKLVTPFSGSDATLISVSGTIGDTGSANRFVTATEMTTNGGTTPVYLKGGVVLTGNLNVYTAADTVQMAITGTGGKALNTLTAGEVHVLLKIVDGRV